jgi:hypothetical protein
MYTLMNTGDVIRFLKNRVEVRCPAEKSVIKWIRPGSTKPVFGFDLIGIKKMVESPFNTGAGKRSHLTY